MKDKISFNYRVSVLASKLGLEQTKVHNILTVYTNYCKELLVMGYRVDFLGLASIIPDTDKETMNVTLAYECSVVADLIKLPMNTVFTVINEYLLMLREDLLNDTAIEIRGLFSMFPLYSEIDDNTVVHSSISSQLKKYLAERNSDVKTVRIHTCKMIKHTIKESNYVKEYA